MTKSTKHFKLSLMFIAVNLLLSEGSRVRPSAAAAAEPEFINFKLRRVESCKVSTKTPQHAGGQTGVQSCLFDVQLKHVTHPKDGDAAKPITRDVNGEVRRSL